MGMSAKMPVILSLEDDDGLRCIDIIRREDGTYTFKEFRKDLEDPGRWYLVSDFSNESYATKEGAIAQARKAILWLNRD